MRILHLVSTLESGGIASSVAYLLPELDALPGLHVDVATLYGSGHFARELERSGLTPFRLDLESRYDREAPRRLRSLLLRGHYDVLHTHGWPALFLGSLARPKGPGSPRLVTTEHNVTNGRRRPLLRPLDRLLYRPYAQVVAVSQAVADSLAAWQPSVAGRITTIHNGIRPEHSVACPGARESIRKELDLPTDATVLIAVGRLIEQKGIDVLLDALHQLPEPRPYLLLAGQGVLQPSLERQAARLGLGDRVLFLGFRPDVPELLAASDLFVLPSRWEGCPMVLLEALAAGLPAVVTPAGGVPEMIEDGKQGLFVPIDDTRALAVALANLIAHPERRRSFAEAGIERVAEAFDASTLARAFARVYGAEPPRGSRLAPSLSSRHLESALGFLIEQTQAEPASPPATQLRHPATRCFEPALRALLGSDIDPFDEDTRIRIQTSFRRTAATNLIHQECLSTVLARFVAAKIPALVLKGIVSSETLYPSIGARPMVDIDILVPDGDVPEAARILLDLGYRPEAAILTAKDGIDRIDQLTKSIGTFHQENVNAIDYPQSPIDLHWNLINVRWFRLASHWPMDELRARAIPVEIGRTQTLALHPLDAILHLAYHQAVKHHLTDVKDFLDLDLLCRRDPEALYDLPARARSARFRSATYHALTFSRALFNTPIPERVLEELCPDPLRLYLVRRIVNPELLLQSQTPRINIARGFLLNVLMIDRWRDLLKIGFRSIWPDALWLKQRMEMAGASPGNARLWHLRRLGRYVTQALRPGRR